MKISEAFDLYKQNYLLLKNTSTRTIDTHDLVGRRMVEKFSDCDVADLTASEISKFVRGISNERSPNTVRLDVIRIRQVFRYLRLLEVPCINYELIPVPKRHDNIPVFLTSEEVSLMIDSAFSLRNKFVISLLYSSGIRLSEMIGLNRGQIVNKKFSVVGKGGKARLCFIDDRTEKLMKSYLDSRADKDMALIVSYQNKKRMTHSNVQQLVSNSAKRVGIRKKVTPHTLRHSFATNFLQNNGNMRYLSQMLGHASLNTTARYAHVVDVDLENQYKQFHSI